MENENVEPGVDMDNTPELMEECTGPVGEEIIENSNALSACSGSEETDSVSQDCVLGVGGGVQCVCCV